VAGDCSLKTRMRTIDPKATPATKFVEWLVPSVADIRALLLLAMSRIRKTSISPRPRTVSSPHAAQDSRPFDLIGIAICRAQAQYPMGATLGGAK
jgi:hypothetical protein